MRRGSPGELLTIHTMALERLGKGHTEEQPHPDFVRWVQSHLWHRKPVVSVGATKQHYYDLALAHSWNVLTGSI
jgi:hypothetical protein